MEAALLLLSTLIFVIATIRRIYHLARYFQLEGYESKRYLRWFARTRRETRYALGTLAGLLLLIIPALNNFAVFGIFARNDDINTISLLQAGLACVVAVALLLAAPRDKQVKQPFNATPRANRLLVVAFVLGVAWPVYYVLMLMLNLGGGRALNPASTAFFSGTGGAIALLLSPLMLPLANLVLWPYEEALRRYFLRLAKDNLRRSGATVICITGSYGKTSTKHYLQHILSARYNTLMTPKSFNTLMGISRAINDRLAGNASYDYFIVEADAYFVGENASICRLVEPQIGMVMTVGPMHLERLGSMENIATAQYEIIAALPPDGAGIFNGDDPLVRAMTERGHPQTRLIVTQTGLPGARIAATNVQTLADGLHFNVTDSQSGECQRFYAPLYGETNVTNILMATAVAVHLGMSLAEIARQVATLQPAEHRLVRRALADGTVIIDDAYSANPVGTKAALDVLKLQEGQRRIVISSGMFELGALADQENRKLGENMAAAATDVILIGPKQTAAVRDGLLGAGFPAERVHTVESLDEAIAIYRGILQPGDALLMLTDLPDTYAE